MTNWKLFDHYSLRARLQPALLTLLPAAFGVIAWSGPSRPWMSTLWTLFGTAGGTYFLAILARNQGKKLEPKLWKSWGGTPTTQLLRHSGPANPVMRERWHKYLSKLVARSFPTEDEEIGDPTNADHVYEAGVKLLINKTRDVKKFSLVYKENVLYGFCRNLYAMRIMGIFFSLVGMIASFGAGFYFLHESNPQIIPWVCGAASMLFLLWWLLMTTSDWVKVPAFAYAERLLESTENISHSRKADGMSKKESTDAVGTGSPINEKSSC